MFSDRFRFLKMALLLAVILCSFYYSNMNLEGSETTLLDCMEEPEACDNKRVVIVNKWAVSYIGDDGFEISMGYRKVFMNYSSEGLAEGDYVSATGVFRKEGRLDVESMHVHRFLLEKWIISLIVTIIVAFAFFRSYRFDFGKFEFRRRGHA
jgi:hypothetical protein